MILVTEHIHTSFNTIVRSPASRPGAPPLIPFHLVISHNIRLSCRNTSLVTQQHLTCAIVNSQLVRVFHLFFPSVRKLRRSKIYFNYFPEKKRTFFLLSN